MTVATSAHYVVSLRCRIWSLITDFKQPQQSSWIYEARPSKAQSEVRRFHEHEPSESDRIDRRTLEPAKIILR